MKKLLPPLLLIVCLIVIKPGAAQAEVDPIQTVQTAVQIATLIQQLNQTSGLPCKDGPFTSVKEERAVKATNPDCWELRIRYGIGVADAQGLQQIFQQAGDLIKQLFGGGGGDSGGSGYDDYYGDYTEPGLNYSQEDAINDIYANFGSNNASSANNIYDFFAPNQETDSVDGSPSGDDAGAKPGLSPQAYFGTAGGDQSNDNSTSNTTNDSANQTNSSGQSNNTDSNYPNSGSGSTQNTSGQLAYSGSSGVNSNNQNDNVHFLDDEGPDRIIIGGDDPYGSGTDLPTSGNQSIPAGSAQGANPNDYGNADYVYTDANGQQYFDWQAVDNNPDLVDFLLSLGILTGTHDNYRLSKLSWFLVAPSHGIAAGLSDGALKLLR